MIYFSVSSHLDSNTDQIEVTGAMVLGAVRISGAHITGEGDTAIMVGEVAVETIISNAGLHFSA